jgi:ferredoxin-thioredoxin reductase catalytic chain
MLSRHIFLVSVAFLAVLFKSQAFVPMTARTSNKLVTALRVKDAGMTAEERAVAVEKATKAMTAFTNTYLKNTGTTLCSDLSVPAVVIKGLAEHKVTLGAPLCPCRFYDDKEAEAKDGFWNCPCVPMRERHECHCMLFLTEDNDFAGEATVRESCYDVTWKGLDCVTVLL